MPTMPGTCRRASGLDLARSQRRVAEKKLDAPAWYVAHRMTPRRASRAKRRYFATLLGSSGRDLASNCARAAPLLLPFRRCIGRGQPSFAGHVPRKARLCKPICFSAKTEAHRSGGLFQYTRVISNWPIQNPLRTPGFATAFVPFSTPNSASTSSIWASSITPDGLATGSRWR